MQIHNNTLMAECSTYDFKEMLERKKVKSWLKSISAFANTDGGSLFYGVNDDRVIVGLNKPMPTLSAKPSRQDLTLCRKYNLFRLNTKDIPYLK